MIMKKVTVVILTKNDEANILDCLESVEDFDEILVIDDKSTDRTLEIVKKVSPNIKIFQHVLDGDFASHRNFALKKVTNEWVLFVDSDERVSGELLKEIKSASEDNDGYLIKRKDVLWGKKLFFGETANIKLLRLGKIDSGEWVGKVHEKWKVNGRVIELKNSLIHYPHQSVKEFLKEIDFYSTLRARELFEKKEKVSWWYILIYPKAKFFINYFLKLGLLDGVPGFIAAAMMSLHSFLVRSKLWLLYKNE